jgi:LuxR family transcriptional regulator, maltose regulon positive regulatory protein
VESGAGWSELRAGRWEAAREAFAAAEESAATLEGLSWAAWWLDEAGTVFDARERAYRLYHAAGDDAGAARMATWLAGDELDFHGAATVAGGWLQRARRLLEPLDAGPDHGWLAFHEGYVAHASGDGPRAIERGVTAAELGRRFAVPDLEMLGLGLQGAALVASAHVEDGMRCLDEATAAALAGEATIPISSAWTCCFLVNACTAVQDYDRASEWCDRIAEFAERYGSRYMLGFCRAEYGAVHVWRGRWAEAEELLEGAIEAFARSRPAYAGGPIAQLAELRRRQGRTAEAVALVERAGTSHGAQLCRARLALDAGDPRTATELVERLDRRDPSPDQAPLLDLRLRASIAEGDLESAATALADLQALAQRVGTGPLRSCADLADGMLAAARGDHERARTLLEDAVDGYERSGAPYEAAQARVELAATLAALGRTDRAGAETAAAVQALRELGVVPAAPDGSVTPREREVLALLAEGLTNRQIAARLVVSEHTVHRHVTNILRKLDLPSRAAAAAHAVRAGL